MKTRLTLLAALLIAPLLFGQSVNFNRLNTNQFGTNYPWVNLKDGALLTNVVLRQGGSLGNAGQVATSTGTGFGWSNAPADTLTGAGTSNYLALWTGTNLLGAIGTNDVAHGGTALGAVGAAGFSLVSTGTGFGFSNIVSSVASLSNITDSGYASLVRSNLVVTGGDAGTLGLNVGNNALVVTNDNVGIGTTTPNQKMSVNGNIEIQGATGITRYILTDEISTGTGRLVMQAGSGSAYYGGAINLYGGSHATKPGSVAIGLGDQSSGAKFTVNNQGLASGTDVFTVLQTGNVGIGTTNPLTGLHVKGVYPIGFATIERTSVNGAGSAGVINIKTDAKTVNDATIFAMGALDSADNAQDYFQLRAKILDPTSTSEDSEVQFWNMQAGTMTQQMVINNLGNVGIGTTTQLSKLSINGGVHVGGDSDAGDNNLWVDGNIRLPIAGGTLEIKEGANASMGVGNLDGGTPAKLIVTNSLVTATSRIFPAINNATSGLFGYVACTARVVSTNFTITSTLAGDTNQVVWHIIEPAP